MLHAVHCRHIQPCILLRPGSCLLSAVRPELCSCTGAKEQSAEVTIWTRKHGVVLPSDLNHASESAARADLLPHIAQSVPQHSVHASQQMLITASSGL